MADDPEILLSAMMLMTGALQAATMKALVRKGVFNAEEAKEIYEAALLDLDERRGTVRVAGRQFDIAREMMESQLRKASGEPSAKGHG